MCGIAGIVALGREGKRALTDDDARLVRRMCDVQSHRGPDDSGVELVGDAALGSLRLSILDLSPAGHMPMASADGRAWIAYNGEVYNYRELREELRALGHEMRSGTDTEVVLTAFRVWGDAALEKLAGMFAFVIADLDSGDVTVVRDRLGIKPVHYHVGDGRLVFASEIKAVELALGTPELDERSLLEWAFYQSVDVPTPDTLFRGVRSLLPGELLRVRGGEVSVERWYEPASRVRGADFERLARLSLDEVVEEVDRGVHAAVTERLVSDVPVGTLLSGGLDSSLITAVAAEKRDLTAFHVSVQGQGGVDELPFAQEVAGKLGIELVTHAFGAAEFRAELPRIVRSMDVPLTHANSVAYSIICRKARERDVIVLLSGEGADELFGGYSWRYRRQQTLARLQRWLDRLPRKVRTGLEFLGAASLGLPVEARRFEQLVPQGVQLVDGFARRDWRERCEAAYPFVSDAGDRALLGALLSDLGDFLTPLLRRLDRMSMGASVECRVPFLDHRLVELAIHLPLELRVGKRADKYVLKKVAERYLSPGLIHRKKMGFPLPLADYLAPFATMEFFRGGFWCERLGVRPSGIESAFRELRREPFAFLALVSGELWGRMVFGGESVEDLEETIRRLEHAVA